jgi:hypothetical protein
MRNYEFKTKKGWQIVTVPLPPDLALDLLPFVMVSAAPLIGAQVELATAIVDARKEGEAPDPIAIADRFAKNYSSILDQIGSALLRPDARGALKALASAFRENSTVRYENKTQPLSPELYAAAFTGAVDDLMSWVQGNVRHTYESFFSIASVAPSEPTDAETKPDA